MSQWKAVAFLSLLYFCFLLLFHGNIESNPRSRSIKNNFPSFCRWNLNTLPAYNLGKMFFKAYNAVCKYSFICLTETYIGFLIPSDYVFLDLDGYKVVHADHSNNIKRGRVCIYYKKSLAVRVINFPYLQEALLRKSNDHNKRTYDIKSLLLSQIKQRRI